jgi:uncharacterized protein DUF3108
VCASCAGAVAAPPARVSASYDLLKNGLHIGVVTENFEQNRERYRIVSETHPAGVLALISRGTQTVTSRGVVTQAGLQPEHFEARRSDDPARDVSAVFDWKGNALALSHSGGTQTLPLASGMQDRLSAMYQFMYLPLARLGTVEFAMTNGAKIEHYRYSIARNEAVQTPLARFAAAHLSKQRSGDENSTEIWLAQERNFFPVRIVIAELNGDRLEQVLTRLEFK